MTPPSLIKDDAKDEAGSVKSKENDNLKLEMPLHITYIHSDQIVSEICKGCGIDLKVFPIDSTSNRYNRRYSLSFGDYWLDLFSTD